MNELVQFCRGRHLFFAALSLLALAALSFADWLPARALGATPPWDGADLLLHRTINLLVVSTIAWLAFDAFDTRAGVEIIGSTWWKFGWEPWVIFTLMTAWAVAAQFYAPKQALVEVAQTYQAGLQWRWLVPSITAAALAEELVFRGLLQRAFEAYMRPRNAIIIQAVIFELFHLFIYDVPFTGGQHFVWALAYGISFTRTRSLLAPVFLHAGGNLLHAAVFATAGC